MIPIILHETEGLNRVNEPVTVGIPLPRAMLHDVTHLTLHDAQHQLIPHQTTVLAKWFDGSVKWVLLDFCTSLAADEKAEFFLQHERTAVHNGNGPAVNVQETADGIMVSCGAAKYLLDKKALRPFKQVYLGDKPVLDDDGCAVSLLDAEGVVYKPAIHETSIETNGPLRATVKFHGALKDQSGKKPLNYTAKLSFYARSDTVRFDFTLRNPNAAAHPGNMWDLGDSQSFIFKDLSIALFPAADGTSTVSYKTDVHEKTARTARNVALYQESSGGAQWQSRTHLNKDNEVPMTVQGYTLTSDAKTHTGLRAQPVVMVSNSNVCISAGLESFWQNFPKSIEADSSTLTIRLFPQQFPDLHELQGGEQKTHTTYFSFAPPGKPMQHTLPVCGPIAAYNPPSWYAKTQALPFCVPYDAIEDERLRAVIDAGNDGDISFFNRREIIDEYGWRNYGELYGDHEAVYHDGPGPLISHYNNQYDVVFVLLFHFCISSNPRWFRLAYDAANHVSDIDVYHTRCDRPEYNHGLFWHTDHYTDAATCTHRTYSLKNMEAKRLSSYGGGPSSSHLYTHGLMMMYYLTGNTLYRDTFLELMKFTVNRARGRKKFSAKIASIIKAPMRKLKKMMSSKAKQPYDLDGPGRASGNVLNALIDGYIFTGERRYLRLVHKLMRTCISPHDRIERRDLFNSEMRWMYLIFLHGLGRYIQLRKQMGRKDRMYHYARRSLLHYARYMTLNEYPFLQKPEILEYPNETWAAQDMRKSVIFNMAAREVSNDFDKKIYLDQADRFYQASLDYLYKFPTRTLTRPIILIMNYAHIYWYYQQQKDE